MSRFLRRYRQFAVPAPRVAPDSRLLAPVNGPCCNASVLANDWSDPVLGKAQLGRLWLASRLVLACVLAMVVVHLLNMASRGALLGYGILPRSPDHWYQVLTAPFVHGSTAHLANNLIGLSVFGVLVALRSTRLFLWGSLLIILFSGALVWLVGRSAPRV